MTFSKLKKFVIVQFFDFSISFDLRLFLVYCFLEKLYLIFFLCKFQFCVCDNHLNDHKLLINNYILHNYFCIN